MTTDELVRLMFKRKPKPIPVPPTFCPGCGRAIVWEPYYPPDTARFNRDTGEPMPTPWEQGDCGSEDDSPCPNWWKTYYRTKPTAGEEAQRAAPAGDADIVEAVAVEVAPQQCESLSPYEVGGRCAKAAGHPGHHRNHDKESW